MTETPVPTPKVSILIPAFNREQFLAECIQSALDQTFTDFEIVISDNASTDKSWEICESFAKKDSRIRIFRNETNIGPLMNWLHCVRNARGQYIKILFSDDLMFPEFLAHTLPYMDDEEIAFATTAAINGVSPHKGHSVYVPAGNAVEISTTTYLKRLINDSAPYSPGAGIFRSRDVRKNLLAAIPTKVPRDFFRNGAGPDVLLYALTSTAYKSVAMLHCPDVFFRAHPQSITVSDPENDVFSNYSSVLAWFFRKKAERHFWFRYVSIIWLQQMVRSRQWVPLRRYCINYDGNGSIADLIGLTWYSFARLFQSLLRRVMRLGKASNQDF